MNGKRSGALSSQVSPPDDFEVDELVVRRWQPDDLMARFEAVTSSRSASKLTSISLALPGVELLQIHCDANARSAAVTRRIGYRLDRVEPRAIRALAESGRGMIWIKGSED